MVDVSLAAVDFSVSWGQKRHCPVPYPYGVVPIRCLDLQTRDCSSQLDSRSLVLSGPIAEVRDVQVKLFPIQATVGLPLSWPIVVVSCADLLLVVI